MTLYSKNHRKYISYSTITLCKLYQASCTPLLWKILYRKHFLCQVSVHNQCTLYNEMLQDPTKHEWIKCVKALLCSSGFSGAWVHISAQR